MPGHMPGLQPGAYRESAGGNTGETVVRGNIAKQKKQSCENRLGAQEYTEFASCHGRGVPRLSCSHKQTQSVNPALSPRGECAAGCAVPYWYSWRTLTTTNGNNFNKHPQSKYKYCMSKRILFLNLNIMILYGKSGGNMPSMGHL